MNFKKQTRWARNFWWLFVEEMGLNGPVTITFIEGEYSITWTSKSGKELQISSFRSQDCLDKAILKELREEQIYEMNLNINLNPQGNLS